jgi:hypothetical protein
MIKECKTVSISTEYNIIWSNGKIDYPIRVKYESGKTPIIVRSGDDTNIAINHEDWKQLRNDVEELLTY